jgi:hypothetical protein
VSIGIPNYPDDSSPKLKFARTNSPTTMAVNIQRIANVELIRGAADKPETRLDLRNRRVMISTTVIAGPEPSFCERYSKFACCAASRIVASIDACWRASHRTNADRSAYCNAGCEK